MAIDAAVLRAKVEVLGAREAQADLRGVGQQFDAASGKARSAGGGFQQFDQRARGIQASTRSAQAGVTQLGASTARSGQQAAQAGGAFTRTSAAIGGINPVAMGAAAGIGALGIATRQSIGAAIEWESSLAGVAKTLDTTGLSAAQADAAVAQIGSEIRQMALDIPIAATELAGVAEAAGQLGIARDDVVSFTETMAKLGVATDLTAEQAATSIARIANITGLATEDVDNFGSALVDLGNNSAATESEILNMATRIAAAGEMAGLTEGEILGLSAALTSVGVRAEAGGTAITQVMTEIETSVESADDRLSTFAEIAGMSASQFADAWRTAPNEAIASFVEGLGSITSAGGSTVQVLDELGLDGIRVSQALNSAAGAGDLMRESMDRGNTAMEENVALSREAEQRFKTTAAQLQLFKNAASELGIALGTVVLPALVDITSELGDFASGLADVVTVMTADPTMTDVVDEWDEQLTRFGELPNRIPDPPEEKGTRWGSFFSDLAGVDWDDLWEGMFPDKDRFETFQDVQLPDVTDEQISKLQNLVDLYENTPARVRTVSEAEYERAQIMLDQIELYQQYNALTDDQRAGLENLLGVVENTMRGIVGLNTEIEAGAQDYKFLEENTFSYQGAAEGLGDSVSALNDIFRQNGDVAADMVSDIVLAVTSGAATFEEAVAVFAGVPEDVLFPALEDLEEELQGKLAAALLEGTNPGPARAQLEELQGIMEAVGFTVEEMAEGFGTFGEIQDQFQLNIENAAAGVSEWEGHLSGAEAALSFLQEKIDAGIPLTEDQLKSYDDLTWATERYAGGVEDESQALIDAEVAKAQFIKVQDELNAALESGEITQSEYNDAIGAAAAELDPATSASMGLADAQGALQESIDGTVEKLVRLMVELGILDETEAEAILGVDTTEAEANVTHMEGRLQTYEGITSTATADVDDSNAVARIDGVEGELTAYAGAVWTTTVDADVSAAEAEINRIKAMISAGAMLPVAISSQDTLQGFASGTGPSGTTRNQLAWVGEQGPELAWLPEGTHILPSDESMKFASLLGEIPGFANGTGGGGGGGTSQGVIDIGGFEDVGMSIADAINRGIQRGLDLGILESAGPTGSEIAQAMIDGAVLKLETEGEDPIDTWRLHWERVPEIASQIGHDAVIGLIEEYANLQGELQLAILSGGDVDEVETRLVAIEELLLAWGGDAVGEIESIGEAMEAALDMERFAGLFDMPGSAAPFDITEIFGGDALDQVRNEFHAIFDLQRIAQDLGYDEFANDLGDRLADLGLQEEMLEGIMGSDIGQQVAARLEAELKAEMDAQRVSDMWSDIFSGGSFAIEDIFSGDAMEDLQAKFHELFDLQRVAQELGLEDVVAEIGQQMADLGLQEQMINDMLGSDFGAQMAEQMQAEEAARIAAEEFAETWQTALDAAFSDNPANFAESVQDQINDLESKIDLAPVLGIPADIVEGWHEELAGLQGDQEAFWQSLAEGIAAGLVDPEVLEDLDEAGQAQLEAYLAPIIGEAGAQKIIEGIGAVTQITAEGLGQLRTIFEEDTEAAVGYIDELIDAAVEGSITWADAMGLMGEVPRNDLLPVLEDLEQQFEDDLVRAILATDDAAQAVAEQGLAMVQEAIAGINDELGDLMGFADDFARLGSGGVGVITSAGSSGGGGRSGGGSSGGGSRGGRASSSSGGAFSGGGFSGGGSSGVTSGGSFGGFGGAAGDAASWSGVWGKNPTWSDVRQAELSDVPDSDLTFIDGIPTGANDIDWTVRRLTPPTDINPHIEKTLKPGNYGSVFDRWYSGMVQGEIPIGSLNAFDAARWRTFEELVVRGGHSGTAAEWAAKNYFYHDIGKNIDAYITEMASLHLPYASNPREFQPGTGPRSSTPNPFPRFADGGVALDEMLAIVGDNPSGKEMMLPWERTDDFSDQIAKQLSINSSLSILGDESVGGRMQPHDLIEFMQTFVRSFLTETQQGGGDIVLQVDGETLGRITSGHLNNMARSHVSQSGIPVGLGRR